jgi:hypothetical protein
VEPLGSPASLLDHARRFDGNGPALAYLHESPDLSALGAEEVEVLLANDDLRHAAAAALRAAGAEPVRAWVQALSRSPSALARRGAYLLAEVLEPEESARLTRPSWERPEDQAAAFAFLHPRRLEARPAILEALEASTPLEGRRFALRMVARSAREGEPDRWAELTDDDPELEALVKVARFKAEEVNMDRLRSWSASVEEPELRVLASLQLWMEGGTDGRYFAQELQRVQEEGLHLNLLLGPMRGLSRLEPLLKEWLLCREASVPVARRRAMARQVVAAGDLRFARLFLESLQDPDAEVRDLLYPYLCEALGLLPVRLRADLSPLAHGDFDELSNDDLRSLEQALVPALPVVPDLRLGAIVGYLLKRLGPDSIPREALRPLGPALWPSLANFLGAEDRALASLARGELEAARDDPRAGAILEDHEGGQDPLEAAVERLLVPARRDEARAALEALPREATSSRLLELARSRKDARSALLDLLADWGAEEAIPFMVRMLGSPLPDMIKGRPGSRDLRWLKKDVGGWLERMGPAARPHLDEALASENWTVRHHAATLLTSLALAESGEALARTLDEESEPECREALVTALGTCGGQGAVEALEPLARGEDLGEALRAVRSLGQVGGATAHKLLEELLSTATDLGLKRELRRALDGGEG